MLGNKLELLGPQDQGCRIRLDDKRPMPVYLNWAVTLIKLMSYTCIIAFGPINYRLHFYSGLLVFNGTSAVSRSAAVVMASVQLLRSQPHTAAPLK
jgi:hypothetical protein